MTTLTVCCSKLILASASPRRRELLSEAGVRFEVIVPDEPEPERQPGEDCGEYARRAAELKARTIASQCPGKYVLGADTIVVLDGEVLGKPEDAQHALTMLSLLSGRTHSVFTGVALIHTDDGGRERAVSQAVESRVTFRELAREEIEGYVGTGEPLDKAGAYGIQGLGGQLVAGYDGSYTNVVGLPMEAVMIMLRNEGVA